MKKLKVNLVAVLALTIAVTTMSFNLYNKEAQTERWYTVDEANGAISSTPLAGDPQGSCIIELPADVCAVNLPTNHSYINISQVPDARPRAGRQEDGK